MLKLILLGALCSLLAAPALFAGRLATATLRRVLSPGRARAAGEVAEHNERSE
jgi:hypothetical protein